ncbi:iron ABC transporter permease [Flavobacteriales bacterium]|nr:iron ABC transporter permease [Flavobacteriales bacterium]
MSYILILLLIALVLIELMLGSVEISILDAIENSNSIANDILVTRINRTVLGIIVGVASALSGLGIQTIFKNPLAGPTTLGVNSGASLGVGIYYLIPGFAVQFSTLGLGVFAILGAISFLLLLISIAGKSFNLTFVLIVGLLLSYGSYAVLEVLLQLSDSTGMKNYIFWGMGSLNKGHLESIIGLALISILGVIILKKQANWLNVYNLGEQELKLVSNKSIGFNKRLLLIVFGVWIGAITSVVGPIAFVGIVVPNVLKLILKTSDINRLLPLSLFLGAILVLLADLISRGAFGGMLLPINAVLSVLGVPVIIYFIFKKMSFVKG